MLASIFLFPSISCKCCGKQYVGSATGFKESFKIHKSDINTGKIRCGVANHLLNVCRSSTSKFEYLQLQLIEKVSIQNDDNIDKVFLNEWYVLNRKYGNGMLWTEEVIENNTINFSIFDNEMYQRDNCIKREIRSDVILLVSITLFCDLRRKSESLEDNVIAKELCFLSTWC